MLSDYFQDRVGEQRPGYEGELSAPYNETLLAALSQIMGQTEGRAGTIDDLIARFSSPAGAQGWNPVSAGWNRYPNGPAHATPPLPGTQGSKPPIGSRAGGISPEIAQFVASRMGMGG